MPSTIRGNDNFDSQSSVAKAWVSFNGSDGTVIDSSNIVSVVTDGSATYTVTFEDFGNTNYTVLTGVVDEVSAAAITLSTKTSNSISLRSTNQNGSLRVPNEISLVIFSNQ